MSTCKTCLHNQVGFCHRNPPVVGVHYDTVWPMVEDHFSCGEWDLREGPYLRQVVVTVESVSRTNGRIVGICVPFSARYVVRGEEVGRSWIAVKIDKCTVPDLAEGMKVKLVITHTSIEVVPVDHIPTQYERDPIDGY